MIEQDLTIMEGAGYTWRFMLKDADGDILPPDGFFVYGAAACPYREPRVMQVTSAGGVVTVMMPGLPRDEAYPWSYQIFVREKISGVEWLLAHGAVLPVERVAGDCGAMSALWQDFVAVLDANTHEVSIALGDGALVAQRAAEAAEASRMAASSASEMAAREAVKAADSASAAMAAVDAARAEVDRIKVIEGPQGPAGKDAEITKEALAAVLPMACTAEGVARADVSGVLVVGAGARARSENQVIVGNAAYGETEASRAAVFGDGAEVGYKSAESVAVGAGAKVSYNSAESVAVGARAAASASKSVAQGWRASAGGMGSVALGSESRAVGTEDVIVGHRAKSENIGQDRVAVGRDAVARGNNAVGVGALSRAVGENALAVGYNVRAEVNAVAVGVGAFAAERGAAFGNYAYAGEYALALGDIAVAEKNSIVLQCGSADGVRFSLEMVAGEATGERGSVCGEDSQAFLRGGAFRFRVRDILSGTEEVCTFSIGELFKALQGLGAVVEMQADGYSYGKGDA